MRAYVIKGTTAYKVEIFIGGDQAKAIDLCEAFCTSVGLCVTVEPTTYAYRGGRCEGVRVGLINYARFPKAHTEIWETAEKLADYLLTGLGQGSYTIQDDRVSLFYSERDEDVGSNQEHASVGSARLDRRDFSARRDAAVDARQYSGLLQ